MKTHKKYFLPIIAVLVTLIAACPKPVAEKVAVLLLSWGAPAGYCPDYAWNSHQTARIGDVTEYEGQPCKFGHVGEFPYEIHIGMLPWQICFEEPGYELFYDRTGIYKWVEDGAYYESIDPDASPVTPDMIPAEVPLTPAVEEIDPMSDDLRFPPDPRTGEDLLDGWYIIGSLEHPFQNGIGDVFELTSLTFIRWGLLMEGPTEMPEECLEHEPALDMSDYTKDMLATHFGDQVDTRVGMYTAVSGLTQSQMDVAEEFANDGFTKMLITRETTDYNLYANDIVGKNFVKERLCEIGKLDEVEIHQTRQVGRTPEFNALNVMNLRKYIEAYPEGSTIAMIYVTHGGSKGAQVTYTGFMSTQYEWFKELREENAYLNYLSWKKAVQAAYGDRCDLVFTKGGVESDLREDNLWSWGMVYEDRTDGAGINIRQAIRLAKEDGHDKILVAPCHWFYDCIDTLVRMREINNLPLQPKGSIANHQYDITWCEESGDTWIDCSSQNAVTEITLAQAYSNRIEDFATCYYVRLRGGLEKFGLYPDDAQIQIKASQSLTKLDGGIVEVTNPFSTLRGAKIEIPADPYPDRPEGFTWNTCVYTNDPNDTMDCLWEDLTISIGVQENPPTIQTAQAIGPAVHLGPYRTLFNRDVTITIPYDTQTENAEDITVYIYNHLTEDWESLEAEDVDLDGRLVTFKTKVLGLFQVGLPSS